MSAVKLSSSGFFFFIGLDFTIIQCHYLRYYWLNWIFLLIWGLLCICLLLITSGLLSSGAFLGSGSVTTWLPRSRRGLFSPIALPRWRLTRLPQWKSISTIYYSFSSWRNKLKWKCSGNWRCCRCRILGCKGRKRLHLLLLILALFFRTLILLRDISKRILW